MQNFSHTLRRIYIIQWSYWVVFNVKYFYGENVGIAMTSWILGGYEVVFLGNYRILWEVRWARGYILDSQWYSQLYFLRLCRFQWVRGTFWMGSGLLWECYWSVNICCDCTGTLWSIRGYVRGIDWECGHYSECVPTLLMVSVFVKGILWNMWLAWDIVHGLWLCQENCGTVLTDLEEWVCALHVLCGWHGSTWSGFGCYSHSVGLYWLICEF
jgi:hypothetical protein